MFPWPRKSAVGYNDSSWGPGRSTDVTVQMLQVWHERQPELVFPVPQRKGRGKSMVRWCSSGEIRGKQTSVVPRKEIM